MNSSSKNLRILSVLGIALTLVGYFFLLFETFQLNDKREALITENLALETQRLNKISELKKYQILIDSLSVIASQSKDESTRERSEALVKDLPKTISNRFVVTAKQKSNLELAEEFEKEGFDYLVNKKIDLAIASFIKSENSYNGNHQVYEIANYLNKNKKLLSDTNSNHWKEVYKTISRDFSWKMPQNAKLKLNELAK